MLCSGDFFAPMSPNAGDPQKVQRYPWTWAEVLAEMSGIGAGTLRPGRGPPIEGEEDVREALLDSAAYLHALVEETIEALNDGSPPLSTFSTRSSIRNPTNRTSGNCTTSRSPSFGTSSGTSAAGGPVGHPNSNPLRERPSPRGWPRWPAVPGNSPTGRSNCWTTKATDGIDTTDKTTTTTGIGWRYT